MKTDGKETFAKVNTGKILALNYLSGLDTCNLSERIKK